MYFVVIIPDICHFFYTGKIFGEKNLHQNLHSKLPTYTLNCQFFALNLKKFTPAKKNLHRRRPWRPWQIWGMSRLSSLVYKTIVNVHDTILKEKKTWGDQRLWRRRRGQVNAMRQEMEGLKLGYNQMRSHQPWTLDPPRDYIGITLVTRAPLILM